MAAGINELLCGRRNDFLMIDLSANRTVLGRNGNDKQPACTRVQAVWVWRVKRQDGDSRQAGVQRAPGLPSIGAPEYPKNLR